MGCGCGKNANRNTRSSAIVPNVTQANGSIVNTQNLNPRAASAQSPAGLSLDKREVEKIRQEAIKKALGK